MTRPAHRHRPPAARPGAAGPAGGRGGDPGAVRPLRGGQDLHPERGGRAARAGLGEISLGEEVLFRRGRAGGAVHVPARRRGIGYVFQHYALFPHLTALDNVGYGLRRRPRERAAELLRRPGPGPPGGPLPARAVGRASSSASRWPAPWPRSRACCCWTSRSPPWTSRCGKICRRTCAAAGRTAPAGTVRDPPPGGRLRRGAPPGGDARGQRGAGRLHRGGGPPALQPPRGPHRGAAQPVPGPGAGLHRRSPAPGLGRPAPGGPSRCRCPPAPRSPPTSGRRR